MEYFIGRHKFNFRQFTLYSTFIKIANGKVSIYKNDKTLKLLVARIITFRLSPEDLSKKYEKTIFVRIG